MTTFSSAQKEIPPGMIDLASPAIPLASAGRGMQKLRPIARQIRLCAAGLRRRAGRRPFPPDPVRFLEGIYGMPVDPGHLLVTTAPPRPST